MATTHALLILRVFRCFVFLLVLSGFPSPVVQAQNAGAHGCCYEIQHWLYDEYGVTVGYCIWTCNLEGEPVIVITDIVCFSDSMVLTACREPENNPPCPSPSEPLNAVAQLDCDQFGQAIFPLDFECIGYEPHEINPELFNDCDVLDCDVPPPGQRNHSPTFNECHERGCCGLET